MRQVRTRLTVAALSIVSLVLVAVPSYFVSNYEVPCSNWDLGSRFSLSTERSAMIEGIFRTAPNASKFDKLLPFDLSVFHFSLFFLQLLEVACHF